jgi:hypothetical protein
MSERGTYWVRHPDFIFRRIADELILVPIRQQVGDLQSIYTLTPVAAQIWEWLDGTHSVGQIIRRLTDEYDVTEHSAESDVLAFVSELEKIGAAKPSTETSP